MRGNLSGLFIYIKKSSQTCELFFAEREGFEPPVRCRTTVFKTAAFDHSAISPDAQQK